MLFTKLDIEFRPPRDGEELNYFSIESSKAFFKGHKISSVNTYDLYKLKKMLFPLLYK